MKDIIVKELSMSFGDLNVMKKLSLEFPAGSVSCIMGKSGCGKTTLINIMLGLLEPTGGSIEGLPENISAVFQEDRLCDGFSALANIRLACGKNISEKEIEEAFSAVGLYDSLKTKAGEMSGGMRRRVSIIRALLAKSELIIFDEPFKGLDGDTRLLTMNYVKEKTAGKTVIIITHDEEEAAFFGGRLIKLSAP